MFSIAWCGDMLEKDIDEIFCFNPHLDIEELLSQHLAWIHHLICVSHRYKLFEMPVPTNALSLILHLLLKPLAVEVEKLQELRVWLTLITPAAWAPSTIFLL